MKSTVFDNDDDNCQITDKESYLEGWGAGSAVVEKRSAALPTQKFEQGTEILGSF